MTLAINGIRLDDPQRPYVIAEASGNHGQDYVTAQNLVRAAADAGADAIKFQTFTATELVAHNIPILTGYDAQHDAWVQRLGVTFLHELFAKGGLPREWHKPLKHLAEDMGITFLSTPFSLDAAKFLVEEIGLPALKIASGDLTYRPLLTYAASTGLPVLLSTGGATEHEVVDAVCTFNIALGHSPSAFCGNLAVLHCCSIYPCPDAYANLRVLQRYDEYRRVGAIGWSDHTLSPDIVPALAVACGATLLEKHVTLAADDTTIDADHSLTPDQFRRMVEVVRAVPAIMGDGVKQPHMLEAHDRLWARRGDDGLRPTQAAREGAWA